MVKMYSDIDGFSVIRKDHFHQEFQKRQNIQNEIHKIQNEMLKSVSVGEVRLFKPNYDAVQALKKAGFEIQEEDRRGDVIIIKWSR